jgi:hypothetical protein
VAVPGHGLSFFVVTTSVDATPARRAATVSGGWYVSSMRTSRVKGNSARKSQKKLPRASNPVNEVRTTGLLTDRKSER